MFAALAVPGGPVSVYFEKSSKVLSGCGNKSLVLDLFVLDMLSINF